MDNSRDRLRETTGVSKQTEATSCDFSTPLVDRDAALVDARRSLTGVVRVLDSSLCVLTVMISLAFVLNAAAWFDHAFVREQYLALFLGTVLLLAFIRMAPTPSLRHSRITFRIDLALGVIAFLCFAYATYNFSNIDMILFTLPPHLVALGTTALVLLLEATRRVAGLGIALIAIIFMCYPFLSDLMPGALYSDTIAADSLVVYLYADTNAILGLPLAIAMGVVLSFILFGAVLTRTGGVDLYANLAVALMGRFAGGAGKVSVVASALFGSISGSAVSNVVSTGVITIPMMRRAGFSRNDAGAVEAVASTGGQIMPPIMGATAFLMAELLNVDYSIIVVAALIPAALYFYTVLLNVHLLAKRKSYLPVPKSERKKVLVVMREEGLYLLPLAVIVVGLFAFDMRPEKGALAGVLCTLAVYAIKRRWVTREVFQSVIDAGGMAVQITIITGIAGIIIGVLNITGLGFALTMILTELAGNSLVMMLLLVALGCIVLGMGMPSTALYLILAVLVGPAMVTLGVPELVAHFYIFYFGILSFITPPVCFAAFAAATISGGGPMRTGWEAMKLGASGYAIPFLFVYYPVLLGQGGMAEMLVTVPLVMLALFFLCAGLMGYLRCKLSGWTRFACLAVSILLMLTPYYLQHGVNVVLLLIAGGSGAAALLPALIGSRKRKPRLRNGKVPIEPHADEA